MLMMYHPDKKLTKDYLQMKQRDAKSIRNAFDCRDILKFINDLDGLYREENKYAGGDAHRRLLGDTILALVLSMREEYVGDVSL